MFIINWIISIVKKIKRRWIIARAYVAMQAAFRKQLHARQSLRKDVNIFLKDYFGIDAKSKYIPKKYRNSEEVGTAIMGKFGGRMHDLNLNLTDLYE